MAAAHNNSNVTATVTTVATTVHTGRPEGVAARGGCTRDAAGGIVTHEGNAVSGGNGSTYVTRARKRALEAAEDGGRNRGPHGCEGGRRSGLEHSTGRKQGRNSQNSDSHPPPSYLPTHPPHPHLLTTPPPAMPALVTAEAVAWSSDPGVAGARGLLYEGRDSGHPILTLRPLPPSIAPGAGCREAHCTGGLPPTAPMPTAPEGACREAGPLQQPPPLLTYTYPADGGDRRLCTTTSPSPAPSPQEERHGTAASSVVAAETLC